MLYNVIAYSMFARAVESVHDQRLGRLPGEVRAPEVPVRAGLLIYWRTKVQLSEIVTIQVNY